MFEIKFSPFFSKVFIHTSFATLNCESLKSRVVQEDFLVSFMAQFSIGDLGCFVGRCHECLGCRVGVQRM